MLSVGVVVLGVGDADRAIAFWGEALGYEVRADGFGGWATVLTPPDGGAGPKIALQRSKTPPRDHPRLHLDLHVSSAAEQMAEVARLMAIGAERVDWTAIPTTRTSSCLWTPTAIASASSTSATSTTDPSR